MLSKTKTYYHSNFFRFDKNLVINKDWARLHKASKSVYPAILIHCNEQGKCFPSQKKIAELSGCSPKTVSKGVKNLRNFPGLRILNKVSRRGHRAYHYIVEKTPDKKGISFSLFKCLIVNKKWSKLSSSAHSLYIVLRAFSFFDGEIYSDLEDLEYGYDVNSMIELGLYQKRSYEFVDAEIEMMIEYSGLGKSTVYTALNELKRYNFIEEIEYSIDGYDTWKIYLIPKEYSKDSKLQNQLKIKGLNC